MSSVDLETIREKQLAFFLERIGGQKAEREWCAHVAAAMETWLDTPLERLTTPDALIRVIDAFSTPESFARLVRPLSLAVHLEITRSLRREDDRLGHFVPPSARERVEALLARPNQGAERLLRQVLAQDAMEETMRDVLYDALVEWSEKVNPFVAEWGLPGVMKKLGPFGFGPLAKSIEGVRKEFDRRLEPEMRRFLQGFSRKALDKVGDLMSKSGGSGSWGELRRAVLGWLYDQPIRELMVDVDDEGAALAHSVALEVTEHAAALERVREAGREACRRFFSKHARDPLRKILSDYGAAPVFDAGAVAEATWPAVKALTASEPVVNRIREWLDEFWDQVDASR
jgi:hypothetical protein